MVARTIVALEPESAASVVARLDCGHRRHVRHRPPIESYPWRDRSTEELTAATIPAGLLRRHTLKAGTWGEIVVLHGRLRYRILEPNPREWILEAGEVGTVPPEVPHVIEALGEVRLRVDFYRAA